MKTSCMEFLFIADFIFGVHVRICVGGKIDDALTARFFISLLKPPRQYEVDLGTGH